MQSIAEIELGLVATGVINGMQQIAGIRTEPREFFDFRMRAAWQSMHSLHDRNEYVDTTTLENELERNGFADPMAIVTAIMLSRNTTPDPQWNAERIREAYLARETRKICAEIAHDQFADGTELIGRAYSALAKIEIEVPQEAKSMPELAAEHMAWLEALAARAAQGEAAIMGEPTGIDSLTRLIGGWQRGIVSIVAARPGMGKSSLGLSTAFGAISQDRHVHVFSLEDSRSSYMNRAFSRLSQIPSEQIRSSSYTAAEIEEIRRAANKLHKFSGWTVDDRSGITATEIVRSWRRLLPTKKTKVVLVDYVQRLKWPDGCRNAHEALARSISTLADAAKEDDLACVVFSQLNRSLESRPDKRPLLSDLRESGSLEEIAKCVVGIYRGSYYGEPVEGIDYEDVKPSQHDFERQVELLVLKNSNGATGSVIARWDGATTNIW